MAFTNFSIGVILGGATGSNPNQAQTWQIVTPWGQSNVCYSWEEAVNEVILRSRFSGVMGNYFNNSTTNGTSGSGTAPPLSANNINTTP
jgi:hypothetical protein